MPPRQQIDEGLREADHLKRLAEGLTILGPEGAGGNGTLSRDDIRRFLKKKIDGFDFLVTESELAFRHNGPPKPLPDYVEPHNGVEDTEPDDLGGWPDPEQMSAEEQAALAALFPGPEDPEAEDQPAPTEETT